MAYIYKITNNINQKIYIGKTNGTIEDRWKNHLQDMNRKRFEKRPLYNAIRYYGVDNFSIQSIEECSEEDASEREIFWIKFYNSYLGDGYNATCGGDGKTLLDYNAIVEYYTNNNVSAIDVSKKFNCSPDQVYFILKLKEVEIKSPGTFFRKKIQQYSVDNIELLSFESLSDASLSIQKEKNISTPLRGIGAHIREVANGKRKTAYGYKWKWINLGV